MFLGPANTTGKVDSAFFFIVASAAVLLVLVMVLMIAFLIKYNKRRHARAESVKESLGLEVVWTVIPTLLVLVMFYFGWVNFEYIRNPPKDAMQVDVTARQWSWLFHYANGKEDDVLRVPVNKPVKLMMTSVDVLHCLFIPAFRIKEDCVPGFKTHLWFSANETGSFQIFCSEYCGEGHSHMRSQVIALTQEDFDNWYQAKEEAGPAAEGLKVLKNYGCLGCHSLDGTKKVGPTFKGMLGRQEAVTTSGKERAIQVDEAYIKHYIADPNQDVIVGYAPVMPKFSLSEAELAAILAYLGTLK